MVSIPSGYHILVVGQDEVWHLYHPSRHAGTVVQLADGVGGQVGTIAVHQVWAQAEVYI